MLHPARRLGSAPLGGDRQGRVPNAPSGRRTGSPGRLELLQLSPQRRGNPDFLFPGLSGAVGTADVTSSIMSSHRGDGTINPKPIPDLAGPPAERIVSRAAESRALESFIRGLIVEE